MRDEITAKTAEEAIRHLRGVLYNHPKVQYVRLTRRQAEALIAMEKR